jgi:predicted transcriptional regulator YdeE
MNPTIVERETILLAGFSFFGNPFGSKDPWSEENEIGQLWQRLMTFMQIEADAFGQFAVEPDVFYEVHLFHPSTEETGDFEIFVGTAVSRLDDIPVELVVKVLPATPYAIFTLRGEAISGDWHLEIYQQWMPRAGYVSSYPFSFQCYDRRFKGLENLADSELDVYIPIREM